MSTVKIKTKLRFAAESLRVSVSAFTISSLPIALESVTQKDIRIREMSLQVKSLATENAQLRALLMATGSAIGASVLCCLLCDGMCS